MRKVRKVQDLCECCLPLSAILFALRVKTWCLAFVERNGRLCELRVRWRTFCCTKFQSSSLHSFYIGNTPLGQVLSDSALETVPWIFTHSPPLQKTWRIEIWNFSPASQTMLNFKAFRKLMYVGGENSMSIGTLRKGNDLPMYHLLETSEFGVSRKICGTQMWFVTCGCS